MLQINTPDNVGIGFATAGLGSRMVAQLLDTLVAGVAVFVVLLIYLAIAMGSGDSHVSTLVVAGAVGTAFFVYLGYFALSEIATGGSTLGKSALRLRVMRIDGGTARPTELLIRNIVRLIDVGLGGVGLLVMFFHPSARRLGDLAAGTLVVHTRPAVSLASASRPEPVFLRTPDAGPPIDGIGRLGTHEYSVLRMFLSRSNLSPEQRLSLASTMAATLHERLGLSPGAPERGWPAELFLERVFLQLAQRHT